MGVIAASTERVAMGDELSEAEFQVFEKALDGLRRSSVRVPVVDLSEVTYISSRAIGSLVMLWVDLSDEDRWFDLIASDSVWSTLEKAGVARVFFKRPGETATP